MFRLATYHYRLHSQAADAPTLANDMRHVKPPFLQHFIGRSQPKAFWDRLSPSTVFSLGVFSVLGAFIFDTGHLMLNIL